MEDGPFFSRKIYSSLFKFCRHMEYMRRNIVSNNEKMDEDSFFTVGLNLVG